MNRTLDELEVRAALPLSRVSQELREKCVEIAQEKSPSAAFNLAAQAAFLSGLSQIDAIGVAKATRWLAVVRRDYGQVEFQRITDRIVSSDPKGYPMGYEDAINISYPEGEYEDVIGRCDDE